MKALLIALIFTLLAMFALAAFVDHVLTDTRATLETLINESR